MSGGRAAVWEGRKRTGLGGEYACFVAEWSLSLLSQPPSLLKNHVPTRKVRGHMDKN